MWMLVLRNRTEREARDKGSPARDSDVHLTYKYQ